MRMLHSFFDRLKNKTPHNVKDPVCGMEANEKITFDHEGRKYAFCSDHCRQLFAKEPNRYMQKQ